MEYKQKQIIIGIILSILFAATVFALFLSSQGHSLGLIWIVLSSPILCIPIVCYFFYWMYKMFKLGVFKNNIVKERRNKE